MEYITHSYCCEVFVKTERIPADLLWAWATRLLNNPGWTMQVVPFRVVT